MGGAVASSILERLIDDLLSKRDHCVCHTGLSCEYVSSWNIAVVMCFNEFTWKLISNSKLYTRGNLHGDVIFRSRVQRPSSLIGQFHQFQMDIYNTFGYC